MKNIIKTAVISLIGVVAAVACEKNNPPVFDDANAFVAFDKASATISESIVTDGVPAEYGDTIAIPVTLGSVAGLEAAVTFEIIPDTVDVDGVKYTPKENVNYIVITEGGTLKFDAKNRTRYIEICGKYCDKYTGDLSMNIKLSSKSVNTGKANSCKVTISDVDHPLSFLLGDYEATSTAASKALPYEITIYKDASDDHKIWFDNIFNNPGWAGDDMRYYGNVNEDKTSINIPFGQEAEYKYSGKYPMMLYGLDGSASSKTTEVLTKGSIDVAISTEGGKVVLTFDPSFGLIEYVGDITTGDFLGYLCYVDPGIVATKK